MGGKENEPRAAAAANAGSVSSGVCLVQGNGDWGGLREGVSEGV